MPGYTLDDKDDGVIKNKLGATSHEELEKKEGELVRNRIFDIELGNCPKSQFDGQHLKAIHKHLFQDVYEWAGHTRNESFRFSDGTIATEPFMHKPDGKDFLAGPLIEKALDNITKNLQDADYLRGLPREKFAERAADIMAELNAIHPFRDGNGRTQRIFMGELAKQAGHDLDFTVVTKERMIQASIAAHDGNDPTMMRRLFNEISDPSRVAPLREAIEFLDSQKFGWNDRYIATVEPKYKREAVMVGISKSGEHFMARTDSQILIGHVSALPEPPPERGIKFTFIQQISYEKNALLNIESEQNTAHYEMVALKLDSQTIKEGQEIEGEIIEVAKIDGKNYYVVEAESGKTLVPAGDKPQYEKGDEISAERTAQGFEVQQGRDYGR